MKKVETLYPKKEKNLKDMNIFEKKVFANNHKTTSGNGSVKYSTSGNVFVDDFAAISNYRELRDLDDIFNTMNILFSQDPLTTLKETCYIRLITREPKYLGKKLSIHRGQGLKHEYIGRLVWLLKYHKDIFVKNLDVFVAVGSYEDLFNVIRYSLEYNLQLDYMDLLDYFDIHSNDDLCKKYAPAIICAKKCTTLRKQANNIIAKSLANLMFEDFSSKEMRYRGYNKWKSSGKATEFQAHISKEEYDKLNFNNIPGRALSKLVNSKFLENHNLTEKYESWISSKPVAKFTGYPYELITKPAHKKYQIDTINKQFMGLIETAKQNMNQDSSFIVCVDTSGSMRCCATGTNITSVDIAHSMALYFSYLLKGKFENTYLEFNRDCEIRTWNGNTPFEKFHNAYGHGWCDTEVLSVAELLVKLRRDGYSEEEFPTGALLISDGEFNRRGNKSTFDSFLQILREGGFSEKFVSNFKLVLWDIPNSFYSNNIRPKFESLADRPNYFYMSGLDPAGIAFLTGSKLKDAQIPKTAEELFEAAMNQELLSKLIL